MESLEGTLCSTCRRTFQGENDIGDRNQWHFLPGSRSSYFNIAHHTTYLDLLTSLDDGCFICTWLWDHLEPSMPNTNNTLYKDFGIYCRIDDGIKVGLRDVSFHLKCLWATPSELHVSMLHQNECPEVWRRLETHPWSTTKRSIGSAEDLQTIQRWASYCEANHQHCRPDSMLTVKFFPTRILDVKATDLDVGKVYLRYKSNIEIEHGIETSIPLQGHSPKYPPYWTLSHRWGSQNLLKLCIGNEHEFHQGIPLQNLSPTFRDAILLVRGLGHRYIWIDSLCIMQDSRTDWQKEANSMADIYSHSYCNISAVGASYRPSTTGLFGSSKLSPRLLYPQTVNISIKGRHGGTVDGPWVVWNDSAWNDDIERAPLSSRGWVVQERFLAPRIVHFTRNQIYWECLESIQRSADPEGRLLMVGTNERRCLKTTGYKSSRLDLAQNNQAGAPEQGDKHPDYMHHRHWGTMVSIYIACHLTEESDRFIAMSGIAKTFRQVTGDTYLAGLWKRTLHTDLVWETRASQGVPARRNKAYAPSWSWVSIVGGHTELNIPRGKYPSLPLSLIRLVNQRIVPDPPSGDPTGLLQSAELDIECMIYYYRWMGNSKTFAIYSDNEWKHQYAETNHASGDLKLDTSELGKKFEETDKIEGVCIPVCGVYGGYGGGHNDFLVLEYNANDRYERIGLLRVGGIGRWISTWSDQVSTITLV